MKATFYRLNRGFHLRVSATDLVYGFSGHLEQAFSGRKTKSSFLAYCSAFICGHFFATKSSSVLIISYNVPQKRIGPAKAGRFPNNGHYLWPFLADKLTFRPSRRPSTGSSNTQFLISRRTIAILSDRANNFIGRWQSIGEMDKYNL